MNPYQETTMGREPPQWAAKGNSMSPPGALMRSWVRHRDSCATCRAEHWYAPDEDALCRAGRNFYRHWTTWALKCGPEPGEK